VVKGGSAFTNNLLLEVIVPNVWMWYYDGMVKVLGKALLCLIFSSGSNNLSQACQDHVQTAYSKITQIPAGEQNPVEKIALVISGNEGELYLGEMVEDLGGGGAQNGAEHGNRGGCCGPYWRQLANK
jgi:hypothetical protein